MPPAVNTPSMAVRPPGVVPARRSTKIQGPTSYPPAPLVPPQLTRTVVAGRGDVISSDRAPRHRHQLRLGAAEPGKPPRILAIEQDIEPDVYRCCPFLNTGQPLGVFEQRIDYSDGGSHGLRSIGASGYTSYGAPSHAHEALGVGECPLTARW